MIERLCMWCGETLTAEEQARCPLSGLHRECAVRSIIGSVAHQMRRCSCFVPGAREDEEHASLRDSARAAAALFDERNPVGRTNREERSP